MSTRNGRAILGMAELFYQLCPGDWNRGQNVALARRFFKFLHDKPDAPSAQEILSVMYFRWDTCLLVDSFVHDHGLRPPNDEICVMWHRYEYISAKDDRKVWDTRYGRPCWTAAPKLNPPTIKARRQSAPRLHGGCYHRHVHGQRRGLYLSLQKAPAVRH